MSYTRDAIVTALEKVDGLAVFAAPPAAVQSHHAWPVWASAEWRNPCLTEETWYAFVALPNSAQGATVDAGDVLVHDVAAVLAAVAKVQRVEPWAWPVTDSQATVPVLRFTIAISGGA